VDGKKSRQVKKSIIFLIVKVRKENREKLSSEKFLEVQKGAGSPSLLL